MNIVEVCYKGSRLNSFSGEDALSNAREDAQDHANRNGVRVQLVNGTVGEPRYLLGEVEPCCDGTGWTGNPSERCTEHYEPHDLGEFGFIAVH